MYKLESEKDKKRIWIESITGSRCEQSEVYTDPQNGKWYLFTDLTQIPFTRAFVANKVTSLFALGLSKYDLTDHITKLKTLLKSADQDKYEKAYAEVLDFETKATNATDSIKQMTALACVYFTLDDEAIDSFDNSLQIKKMSCFEAYPEMHGFFLSLQTDAIRNYTNSLNALLQIVSSSQKGLSSLLQTKSSEQQKQNGI